MTLDRDVWRELLPDCEECGKRIIRVEFRSVLTQDGWKPAARLVCACGHVERIGPADG